MCSITISEIQVFPIKPINGLVAFASCVVNNSLYLGNIGIYTCLSNSNSYRLVYPEKILPNGKKIQCVYPINSVAGEIISAAINRKFKELISKGINT